jgi:hypothetical protein
MATDPKSVSDILDRLQELASREERVNVGDVVEALGNRGHGPFLLIPAVIDISPVGGIPGLPTALGLVIALTAVQLLFGHQHLWLPGFLRNRSLSAGKVCKTVDKLRGLARRLDKWFHGRMPGLVRGPMIKLAALMCILLACTVPPLELLPFATTAPMAAIAAFGLALMVRDGLLMLTALALSVAALGLGLGLAAGGGGQG